MIDVGTIGSAPCQVALNDMLIKCGDEKIVGRVTSIYHRCNKQLKLLTKYVKDQDLKFYSQMLNLTRKSAMEMVESVRGDVPHDIYTHLRCCVVALYREATFSIIDDQKENIRRKQKGLPLR